MFTQMHATSSFPKWLCISLCLSACTAMHQVQGPTLHISPKPGENNETYHVEDQGCRTLAHNILSHKNDTTLTGFKNQRSYDRIYEKCMLDLGYTMPPQSFWYVKPKPTLLHIPTNTPGSYP